MNYEREHLIILELNPDDFFSLGDQERKRAVKKAYHRLVQKFHPDKPEVEGISHERRVEIFRSVHHAYKMITDPMYREKETIRSTGKRQANLDAVIPITIPFLRGFFGDRKTISFMPFHVDENGMPKELNDEEDEVKMEPLVVDLHIPENCPNGHKIVHEGKGLVQGERRGNLVLVVNILPHPKFKYNEATKTFSTEEDVRIIDLLKGCEIETETIWGLTRVRVPAATMPESIVRRKHLGTNHDHTLEVRVKPVYPSKEELKSDEYKGLNIDWKTELTKDEEEKQKEKEYQEMFQKYGGSPEQNYLRGFFVGLNGN